VAPLYFFNLVNGSDSIPDLDGIEVEDLRAAVEQAHEAVKELLREKPFANAHWRGWRLEIVDSSGQAVHKIFLTRFYA
jgi:uncharacterized protein DUF6894